MFYSQFILAKKGPLGTIWIAAHLERKLRKNQVADTDIGVSVDSILFPEVPIALRLSSHLLLGVVRIYSRKVNYLFDDCSEALLKIKQAFRSTTVDLPPEESTAPYHSITLPETFDLDDFELPDNDMFQGNFIDHHVSTREQITLQDSIGGAVYSTSQFGLDERFGDGDTSQIGLEIDEDLCLDKVAALSDNAHQSLQPLTVLQNGRSEEITEYFDRVLESHGNETVSASNVTKDGDRGPLTPRLEELKFSRAQEALLSDDHVEADWSNSTDLGSLKSTQCLQGTLSSSIDQHEKDRELESLKDEMEGAQHQRAHPINNMVTQEQECMLADKHSSLLPFTSPEQKQYLAMTPESARIMNDVNASDKVEDKFGDAVTNNQPFVTVKDWIGVESARASEAALSPCLSLVTPESKDPGQKVPLAGKEFACDRISESLCQELHSDSIKQIENERCDQSEDLSKSEISDLHEPEKILSFPNGPGRSANAMLIEALTEVTAGGEDSVARAKSVSGKKRSFTESTITVQSLNSVGSFGVSQQRTGIPDDDDLLSSILVGRRSSIVRIQSTPAALVAASSKRSRTTNRSVSKRKVFMDDAMVLNGDMIRQQLTNTEDIRRTRRKAPCTCSDILTIQRQFLEDEIFCEPVFTSMSQELIYLHCKTFDLRGTVVSESSPNNDYLETCDKREPHMSFSGTERDISRPDGDLQLLPSDMEVLRTDITISKECHQTNEKLGPDDTPYHALEEIISDAKSVETYQHSEVVIAVTDVGITNDKSGKNDTPCHALTEAPDSNLVTSKHVDLHIAGKDGEITDGTNASVVQEHEASTTCDPVYVDNCITQDGGSTFVENNNNCAGCFKQISGFSTAINVEGSLTMENELSEDNHVETKILTAENDENGIGKEVCTDRFESNTHELVTTAKESWESINSSSINLHQPVKGIGNSNHSGVNDDEVPPLELSCKDKNMTICSEQTTVYYIEFDLDKKNASLNDEENQILHDAENQILHDAENHISTDVFSRNLVDVFYDDSATINNTGFLNVEDVEVEDDGDGIQCAEGARNLENSGWSSRTRAVANYLHTLFEKEALVFGRKNLCLDNLLTGKTRKEASRMFFETLVLKTKDYIHVEQIHSYDVVDIKPRSKLMKLEF